MPSPVRQLSGLERDLADRRPTAELVETALLEQALDDDALFAGGSSGALSCLLARGDREGLEAARALSRSPDAKRRDLAAIIFGQFGPGPRTFPDECCDALLDLLAQETDSQVFVTAVFAFGHLKNPSSDSRLG